MDDSQLPISRYHIKAEECVVGFGIPTSYAEFSAARRAGTSDFVVNHCPVWEKYHYYVVANIESILYDLAAWGVGIKRPLERSDVRELFKKYRVVILVSHWGEDFIDLIDGPMGIGEFVERIPDNFDGILDLCVCHPQALVKGVRAARPSCLVKFTQHKARLAYWIQLYMVLFTLVKRGGVSYLDALEMAITGLREGNVEGRNGRKNPGDI
jgi:hypothetical protein